MSMKSHRFENENGAAAIVVALTMVLLLGMAAIAVDVGAAFNERRQDQSGADVGALAGAQFAGAAPCGAYSNPIDIAMCNGTNEAIAVANGTLDDPSLANWGDATRCPQPTDAAWTTKYTRTSPISDCVAFSNNLQSVWVRIPTIDVDTTFGKVIGFDSVATSAFAEAEADLALTSDVIPFLLPGDAAGVEYNCLKTQGNLVEWDVCDPLPAFGNFGSAEFVMYGNPGKETSQACNANPNRALVSNIAKGVDHPMGVHPTGLGLGIIEPDWCPVFSAEPDMIFGSPGVGANLDDGLTRGNNYYSTSTPPDYPGRLSRGGNQVLVRNPQGGTPASSVDDTPLWNYLVTGLTGACANPTNPAEMRACLTSWTTAQGVIFLPSIADSVRLAYVPELWENTFQTPSYTYHIRQFKPIYLDTTFYGCTSNTCSIVHTPGIDTSGPCGTEPLTTCGMPGAGNRNLQAVTAFLLDRGMLPEEAQEPFPGDPDQRTFALTR